MNTPSLALSLGLSATLLVNPAQASNPQSPDIFCRPTMSAEEYKTHLQSIKKDGIYKPSFVERADRHAYSIDVPGVKIRLNGQK